MRNPDEPRMPRNRWCDICETAKTVVDMATTPLLPGQRGHICLRCDRRQRVRLEQSRRYPNGLKGCGGCGRLRPLESFYEELRTVDGLEATCSDCRVQAKAKQRPESPLALKRRIAEEAGEQRCAGDCREMLPLSAFGRRSDSATGHRSVCKSCAKDARRRSEANRKRLAGLEAEDIGTCWCCGLDFPSAQLVTVDGQTECSDCHEDFDG